MDSKPSSVITALYQKYGSYRKIADAANCKSLINHVNLYRIHTGETKNPSYQVYLKLLNLLKKHHSDVCYTYIKHCSGGFMRINVNLDDNLKFLAEHKAKSMGLSLSSFVRFLLSRETEDFRGKVDKVILQAEQSGYEEPIEWEDFKKQLENDIHNAKN